jgi:uncharacterized Ntn-hydrolase superfamily protein
MDIQTQWFNFWNAMADSVMDMSDEEVEEMIQEEGDDTEALREKLLKALHNAQQQNGD